MSLEIKNKVTRFLLAVEELISKQEFKQLSHYPY